MISLDWTVWLVGALSLATFFVSAANCGTALARLLGIWQFAFLRLTLALCLGMLSVAIVGWLVWVLPGWPRGLALATLALANAAALFGAWRWKRHPLQDLTPRQLRMLAAWAALSFVPFLLVTIDFPQPIPSSPKAAVLFDGPYVFKQWTLPVRIQYLVGDYPADNALPAYATEYMVRRLSFADVRPLMPGQEVADRPLLMAAMGLPFRALFGGEFASVAPDEVPRINYVGQSWSNIGALISDRAFASTLAPFIAANATLMVALFEAMELFAIAGAATLSLIFSGASSYFLIHEIFTWPKSMAATFLVAAYLLAAKRKPLWLSFALASLAYLAHPYALVFLGGYFLLHLSAIVREARNGERMRAQNSKLRRWGMPIIIPLCVLVGWELCTRLAWHMNSDLIAQNAGVQAGLGTALWTRVTNVAHLVLPTIFGEQNIGLRIFDRGYNTELISAVGLIALLILPAALLKLTLRRDHDALVLWLALLLPAAGITLVFGRPAQPLMHGWQAAFPILLVIALRFGQDQYGKWLPKAAGAIQLLSFLALLWIHIEEVATRWA